MTLDDTIASWLSLASLMTCATLAIPSHQDSSRSRKVPLDPSKDSAIASLERDIPRLMEQATVPGLSAAVVRNGQTYWLHGFGVMNATSSQPVTPDTVFEAASLSKPVFTYGVLKLVDQGKLSLDTPLTTYLSKPYIEGDDRLAKITARFVLSSGATSSSSAMLDARRSISCDLMGTSHKPNCHQAPIRISTTTSTAASSRSWPKSTLRVAESRA